MQESLPAPKTCLLLRARYRWACWESAGFINNFTLLLMEIVEFLNFWYKYFYNGSMSNITRNTLLCYLFKHLCYVTRRLIDTYRLNVTYKFILYLNILYRISVFTIKFRISYMLLCDVYSHSNPYISITYSTVWSCRRLQKCWGRKYAIFVHRYPWAFLGTLGDWAIPVTLFFGLHNLRITLLPFIGCQDFRSHLRPLL